MRPYILARLVNCSEIIGEGKEIETQRILQEKDIKITGLKFKLDHTLKCYNFTT
jgi:hypothetical protein